MKFLAAALLLASPLLAQPEPFRLDSGGYRWIDFMVRHVPTEVDCRLAVMKGNPTVHVELLPEHEFQLFKLGRAHDALAASPESRIGDLRTIVEAPGKYVVLVVNEKAAPPALVTLDMRTDANPGVFALARELSPARRLTAILVSFALFFAIVIWSGAKLLGAIKG